MLWHDGARDGEGFGELLARIWTCKVVVKDSLEEMLEKNKRFAGVLVELILAF